MAASLTAVCTSFIEMAKSDAKKYAHITPEEKEKVLNECEKALAWLSEKVAMQEGTPKHVPPILMCFDIEKKKDMIERVCTPIMTKPAPKEEPKKEEPKAEDKAKEENGSTEPMQDDGSKEPAAEATPMDEGDTLD